MTDEEKKQETTTENKSEESEKSEENGVEEKETSTPMMDNAQAIAERLEKANEENQKNMDRQEKINAETSLQGRSSAGVGIEKPQRLTDTQYAEALERGEVNPLGEDGII